MKGLITTDIEIVECICRRDVECSAGDIAKELSISQSSVERGLNRLRTSFNMDIAYIGDRFSGRYVIKDWGDFKHLANDIYERLKSIKKRSK